MSLIGSLAGLPPGMQSEIYDYEAATVWGPMDARLYSPAYISSGALDPGNTPTTTLRMGLVMGRIASTGVWTNYNAANTDGSQIAQGILPISLRMADVITGNAVARFYAVMVSGGVKAANLIGLDNLARMDLRSRFVFDDDLPGRSWYPVKTMIGLTANYQMLASDNQTEFNNLNAVGEVDVTLPPIANGYVFWGRVLAAQTLKFISTEGGNIVGNGSLTNNNVNANAIGTGWMIYSNLAGTKWEVANWSSTAVSPNFG